MHLIHNTVAPAETKTTTWLGTRARVYASFIPHTHNEHTALEAASTTTV